MAASMTDPATIVTLAAGVHEAEHEKIVIRYGAAHEAGWLAETQKLDTRWGARDAGGLLPDLMRPG
jgi:hypothetical protein